MRNFLHRLIHRKKPAPVIRKTTYVPPIADDAYSAPEGAAESTPSRYPPREGEENIRWAGKPGYEYNADDPLDIPPFLRRKPSDKDQALSISRPAHKWVMPNPRRLKAAQLQREKENRAIKRALKADLKSAAPEEIVDEAVKLTTKQ